MAGSVTALYESNLASLPLVNKGKVRDIYAVGDRQLLIVTSDRISAFDVILPDPIPGKGAVLTALSNFWFERTAARLKNHLAQVELAEVLPDVGLDLPREVHAMVRHRQQDSLDLELAQGLHSDLAVGSVGVRIHLPLQILFRNSHQVVPQYRRILV